MSNLKALKNRIASVKSTQKITRAMKMVAAAKLRRAEDAMRDNAGYFHEISDAVTYLLSLKSVPALPGFLRQGDEAPKKPLLVVFSSDRGLCGGFNGNIVKAARRDIAAYSESSIHSSIHCVGKKCHQLMQSEYGTHIIGHDSFESLANAQARHAFGETLLHAYMQGEYDRIDLCFGRFETVLSQLPTRMRFLPFDNPEAAHKDAGDPPHCWPVYTHEPEIEELGKLLLPLYLDAKLQHIILHNTAAEHGARMSAMDSASRNASDIIDKLSLRYNRARQAQITEELIEVISGAEAV